MKSKQELLDTYDGPNQGTKREIIRYLYDNPEGEHDPETVYNTIRDECPANTADTVANQLSTLTTEHDQIKHQQRSFYHWVGDGRRRPNRRLHTTLNAGRDWVKTLGFSYGTGLLAFIIWATGILYALISLIPLFTPIHPLGTDFITWFTWAGLMTILGSTAVMIWIPLYLLDVRTA
jgi:hypothetical protein